MKNNFPTEIDEDDNGDESEFVRKLRELEEHKQRIVRESIRRATFLIVLLATMSVSLGWMLRALIFS